MMPQITEEKLRDAAVAKITAKRDELLRERFVNKAEQNRLAARERELDRELAECSAAGKFWGVDFEPPPDASEIGGLRMRIDQFRSRARASESQGNEQEARMWMDRVIDLERRLQAMLRSQHQIAEEVARNGVYGPLPPRITGRATPTPALPTPASSPPVASDAPKMPRVRDIILDQLRDAGIAGRKAAPMQKYIESIYSTQIHGKTVGMTLYRLSQEKLVHRHGQTWFFGPPVAENVPVKSENPGGETPGPSNTPPL